MSDARGAQAITPDKFDWFIRHEERAHKTWGKRDGARSALDAALISGTHGRLRTWSVVSVGDLNPVELVRVAEAFTALEEVHREEQRLRHPRGSSAAKEESHDEAS